ncbi:MAG: lysophospholipase [Anaerolineales bacterium]
MLHTEGTFNGPRGLRMYYQVWRPDTEPRGVILIVHGLGEHSGRYRNFVQAAAPRGYAIYALDHIGHGKSEGTRAFVERFSDFTAPLTQFYDLVRAEQPNKPLFILGHSLGGLITSYYLLDHQDKFTGAVISAPAVKIADNITPTLIFVNNLVSAVLPKMGLLALDPTGISRDPDEVAVYVNDPLNYHDKVPSRTGAEMLAAMQRVTAEAGSIRLPMLLIQGSADKLVDPGGAPMLYEKAASSDKTLKVYEGYYHELFNEPLPDRQKVLDDVLTWLDARTA